ncbi:MAG: hypothetical protein NTY53_23215 [Kiritimatiellaeota bacterium]|nr:hypothetical protein [Kiritimatiellota bacterium]
MDNSIPHGYEQLIQHTEDAADGAHTHGSAIGLVHVPETTIRTVLTSMVGTLPGPGGVPPGTPGLKKLWDAAKVNKSAKTTALRTVNSNQRYFARMNVRALQPVLGESWNTAWNDVGFTAGSLAIPTQPLALLQQMRAYYVANPAREIASFQGVACTAAACEAAVQLISDAASASNQSNTEAADAQKAYLAATNSISS